MPVQRGSLEQGAEPPQPAIAAFGPLAVRVNKDVHPHRRPNFYPGPAFFLARRKKFTAREFFARSFNPWTVRLHEREVQWLG